MIRVKYTPVHDCNMFLALFLFYHRIRTRLMDFGIYTLWGTVSLNHQMTVHLLLEAPRPTNLPRRHEFCYRNLPVIISHDWQALTITIWPLPCICLRSSYLRTPTLPHKDCPPCTPMTFTGFFDYCILPWIWFCVLLMLLQQTYFSNICSVYFCNFFNFQFIFMSLFHISSKYHTVGWICFVSNIPNIWEFPTFYM